MYTHMMGLLTVVTVLIGILIMVFFGRTDKDNSVLKFHQVGYKVINDRLEVSSYNKSLVSHTNIFCYWSNRTTRPINFTISLLKDLPDPKLNVQLYKFMSNEYRYFPLSMEFSLCKVVEQDSFGAGDLRYCGNLYSNCRNLTKGNTYNFCNWVLDSTKFPPYIPFGKYKLAIMLKTDSATVATYYWFGAAEEIRKWK